jgi:DNA-binding CsgD family transcriptional regulator
LRYIVDVRRDARRFIVKSDELLTAFLELEATFNLVVNQIYTRAALSRREAEVLRLLGDGKTTPEIAAKLKVSLKTVQQYCARLKQKLDAANFSRLMRIAVLWRAGVAEIVVRGVGRE